MIAPAPEPVCGTLAESCSSQPEEITSGAGTVEASACGCCAFALAMADRLESERNEAIRTASDENFRARFGNGLVPSKLLSSTGLS